MDPLRICLVIFLFRIFLWTRLAGQSQSRRQVGVTLWGKAWAATAADAGALPPPRAREDLLLASWLRGCIEYARVNWWMRMGDVHAPVSAYASVYI